LKTITILLGFCQVLIAGGLIFLIDMQQSKNEGFGQQMAAKVQTSFKGKAGFEERLNEMTSKLGIAFFVISGLVAITAGR